MSKKARRNRHDANEQQPTQDFAEQRPQRRVELKFLNRTQKLYSNLIKHCDITFAVGKAGTGKTFLAALHAAQALNDQQVKKIVLCRPVINAGGEELGFLPGTINEKMDPYVRPVFDAFNQVWHKKTVAGMIEYGTIEIVPLAFMRGRTFTDTFIIADEMQNATHEQLIMLMTRLGYGSKMVITGDPSQRDIRGEPCFALARRKLADIKSVGFVEFGFDDVVRHPTVDQILRAWEDEPQRDEPNETVEALGKLPMMQEAAD